MSNFTPKHILVTGGSGIIGCNYVRYMLETDAEKFIPTVVRKCLAQESIPVYGDGTNIRDWLYVRDHCSGIDARKINDELGWQPAETFETGIRKIVAWNLN